MLALTHLVAGATVGTVAGRRRPAVLGGIASHALLDSVGHDDATVGIRLQGVLGLAGLLALAAAWGPGSPTVAGALGGLAPDGEIAVWMLRGQDPEWVRVFPTHWKRADRRFEHPFRLPGPGVHIAVETALSAAVCAALVLVGRRRRGS